MADAAGLAGALLQHTVWLRADDLQQSKAFEEIEQQLSPARLKR